MSSQYAPTDTNSALLKLFELADKEGRIDIIAATAPFIKLVDLAYQFDTLLRERKDNGYKGYEGLFSENWRQAFTRPTYSEEEVRRLLSDRMTPIPGYLDFIQEIALASNPESKHHFIDHLCSESHHDQALVVLESLESLQDIRQRMHDDLRRKTHAAQSNGIFYTMGHYGYWNRSTLKVLDLLGMDMDPHVDPLKLSHSSRENLWTESRYDAQVSYVGDVMLANHTPIPKVMYVDGAPLVKDAALGEAFEKGEQYAQAKGNWHSKNYPGYYPAIASTSDVAILVGRGAIALGLASSKMIEGRNGVFEAPVHAFTAINNKLDDTQVRLAMSLLANDHITMLRDEIANDPELAIMLVPSKFKRETCPVPLELTFATKYHRPEALVIRGTNTHSVSDALDTQLYLKGVPSAFFDVNQEYSRGGETLFKLKISTELHYKPDLLQHFTGALERERLGDVFGHRQNHLEDSAKLRVNIYDPTLSAEDNLKMLLNLMKEYKAVLGDMGFRLVAPLDFFEYLSKQKLGFKEEISYHIAGADGFANSLSDHPRLRSSLGEYHQKDLAEAGEKPEDWVAKATRIQDEKLKEKIAGLLDRIDLAQVAELATTMPRMRYLASKFDFGSVIDHLPRKTHEAYLASKLESDLGL